jgi:predicted RNA binding protein YcfA (HicA-like mRNA interferase family)
MPSLPIISGAEAIRVLQLLSFVVVPQRGSHVMLRRGVVPNHRELKTGTLSGLLKQTGVSVDEFIKAMK